MLVFTFDLCEYITNLLASKILAFQNLTPQVVVTKRSKITRWPGSPSRQTFDLFQVYDTVNGKRVSRTGYRFCENFRIIFLFLPFVSPFPGSTLATVPSTRPANTRRYNGGDTKRDVNETRRLKIIITILIIKITIKRSGRGRLRVVNTVACTRVVAALPERWQQTMHAVVPGNRTFVLCVCPLLLQVRFFFLINNGKNRVTDGKKYGICNRSVFKKVRLVYFRNVSCFGGTL